jgi:hypothetical protein
MGNVSSLSRVFETDNGLILMAESAVIVQHIVGYGAFRLRQRTTVIRCECVCASGSVIASSCKYSWLQKYSILAPDSSEFLISQSK